VAKVRATIPKGTPIETGFQDESRVGQENTITRRGVKHGTPHSALKDQRTKPANIFGAICPEHGKGAGFVLPFSNIETAALHLAEISLAIAPRAHAVVLMDQAGWHTTGKLTVPANITSSRCRPSALNLTRSRTSGSSCATTGCRTASSHLTITWSITAARVWSKLIDQPWRIMTIGR